MNTALVFGVGITGKSVARALNRRGISVTISDDQPGDSLAALADSLDAEPMSPEQAVAFAAEVDVVVPAPGVPETHPVIVAAQNAGVPVWSELELAYRWEQQRPGGPRPILAITGTDGKTTTTEMTVAMLTAAGVKTAALGNTDTPLVDGLDEALDAFVVECTSFRLAFTETFRADAAVWLNLAPDHLNWHTGMDSYQAAKAKIYTQQRPGDAAIGFIDDPNVMECLRTAPGRHLTFGLTNADYRVEGGSLVGPHGPIAPIASMARALPHDQTNALAASALVLETGLADGAQIADALGRFEGPRHRLELLGERDGVRWFNDSKATTPHAASAAIRAFDSVVLIAGGSRKGVDLSPMAAAGEGRVRALVVTGESAPDLRAVFAGVAPILDAADLDEAVRLAADAATDGDAVVLSPGCASFDHFRNYEHRGDEFRRLVMEAILQ